MKNTIVHHEGAASLEDAVGKVKLSGSIIKIGLDVHARLYVAVAQYDQLLPKPARRLAPWSFCPRSNRVINNRRSVLLLKSDQPLLTITFAHLADIHS